MPSSRRTRTVCSITPSAPVCRRTLAPGASPGWACWRRPERDGNLDLLRLFPHPHHAYGAVGRERCLRARLYQIKLAQGHPLLGQQGPHACSPAAGFEVESDPPMVTGRARWMATRRPGARAVSSGGCTASAG